MELLALVLHLKTWFPPELLLLDQQPHNLQKELVLVLDLLMLLLMRQLALLLHRRLDQDQNQQQKQLLQHQGRVLGFLA